MDSAFKNRGSGVLLHPSSLPGGHGIGDIGHSAFEFVNFLHDAKQSYWQVLPLGPTGFGHSPYASSSSFAGNPLLIDVDAMAADVGLNFRTAPAPTPTFAVGYPSSAHGDPTQVDFDRVLETKLPKLRQAAACFHQQADRNLRSAFEFFCASHADWLDDYALFMAIKRHYDNLAEKHGVSESLWNTFWAEDIAKRDEAAMRRWAHECHDEVVIEKVLQFYFDRQWSALKRYANERGIQLIGDIPIFVAFDSADVWSSPEMFRLDEHRQPIVVAGVPPDYFSETGQRWGNPLYDWDAMQKDNFAWWMRRFESIRRMVDIVRIDHFRGFEACWSIPAECPTAIEGQWVKSPGEALFTQFQASFTDYPILAEDLGLITPEVDALRTQFGFPGMRVLQFAFDPYEPRSNHFLPHNYEPDTVVYTGTHDNDTSRGWFESQAPHTREIVTRYIGGSSGDVAWDLIRLALASVAKLSIVPMQDLLSLGTSARMNRPSTIGHNWSWRLTTGQVNHEIARRMAELTSLYGRA